MAPSAEQPHLDRQQFFAWEADQTGKHEYWQGEVFAMTGARRVHGIVLLNVAALLKAHLRDNGCRAFIADLEVAAADAAFYPDVLVTCDAADLATERVLRHPKVLIQVLSDSTAAFAAAPNSPPTARCPACRSTC